MALGLLAGFGPLCFCPCGVDVGFLVALMGGYLASFRLLFLRGLLAFRVMILLGNSACLEIAFGAVGS